MSFLPPPIIAREKSARGFRALLADRSSSCRRRPALQAVDLGPAVEGPREVGRPDLRQSFLGGQVQLRVPRVDLHDQYAVDEDAGIAVLRELHRDRLPAD